jgi:hypothetical protein
MAGENPQVRKPAGSSVGTDLVKYPGASELAAMCFRPLSYSNCCLEYRHPLRMLDGETSHCLIRRSEQSELIHEVEHITAALWLTAANCVENAAPNADSLRTTA